MWKAVFMMMTPVLAGCAEGHNSHPLVFGTATTLGVSVGATAASGGTPELTVGFKRAEIAIVPTTVPAKDLSNPDKQKIRGLGEGTTNPEDALSTFGSFESDTTTNSVGIGTFFATGVAAQRLAEGIKCKFADKKSDNCIAKSPN